jgi:hypothetical protein
VPFEQQPVGEVTMIVRTRGPQPAAMEDFRRALRALDPAMPAMQIVTLDQHMKMALIFERTAAILVGTFGGLALVLALAGLYGVISSIAARRTREIGIRMALGAHSRDVMAQVLNKAGGSPRRVSRLAWREAARPHGLFAAVSTASAATIR